MNKIICYLNDNYIDIKKNNKIYHIVMNSIKNGDITNKKSFIKEIKKYNLFSNIINNYIIFYINKLITEKDDVYYTQLFEELNSSNIKIYSTKDKLLSPTLINNLNNYILFYDNNYLKINKCDLHYFLKKYNIKNLNILSSTNIEEINNIKYYYYNNFNTYFLN